MEIVPLNLTELIPSTLAVMIPLVAVLGFTLRFTLKPLIEAYARARAPMGEIPTLQARVALLEAQLASMQPRLSPTSTPVGEPISRLGSIERI